MKATFFALATMAATAFAAPAPAASTAPTTDVSGAIEELTDLLNTDIGLGQIVDGATSTPTKRANDIKSGADLNKLLEGVIGSIKGNTGSINSTMTKVQDGSISKDDATTDALAQLKDMHFKLTDILTKILGAAGLDVASGDIDRTLTLVVALLSEVLFTVKSLVTILGIRAQLVSILHSVFGLLGNILTGLVGLLAGLLPGLVAALTPLLAGLGNGVLAPLLTGVAGLLASLALGL